MRSNDFRVDTTPSASPSILRKRQTLLGLALLLTIPQMISAVYLPSVGHWMPRPGQRSTSPTSHPMSSTFSSCRLPERPF